ncbi:MAG: phytanoyl-CoA dioxygenase family protein [Phycisphaeraceae bacterium]|nr:phytanoyl-CoA dioxygenase family protein [Phycisphaeraceae bacterium]
MAELASANRDVQRDMRFFPVRNDQPGRLTPAQIKHFNDKGYITPLDVFSASEVAEHRAWFDRILEEAARIGHDAYSINGWHLRLRGLYDLVNEPRILDYVQDLLGENLICWGTHYFCKMPGETKRVSWHQDASYWPLTPTKTVTAWLAIDDADEENGAMKFIPRSHRHGHIAFEASAGDEKNVLDQTVLDAESYGDAPVSIPLKAGQMEMHSDLLLHSSEANPSTRRRCGLTMRLVPPQVRALKDWNRLGILCRGRDDSGHWPVSRRPPDDDIPPLGWAP